MRNEYLVCITVAITLMGSAMPSQVRDEKGEAMFAAAQQGDLDAIKSLLAEGVDVNKSNPAGVTTLHVAAGAGQQEVCAFLLDKGAEINAKAWGNQTPLHWAASAGRKDVAVLLLEKGADVNAKDSNNHTPLDIAVLHRPNEVVDVIVKHDLESTDPSEPKHGVCITNAIASSACTQGDMVSVTVNVANHGTFRESFEVILRDRTEGKQLETKRITLGKEWKGKADDVADLIFDAENADKNFLGNRVCIGGDVNGDGISDLLLGMCGWQDWRGRTDVHFGGPTMDTRADLTFTGENLKDRLSDQSGTFGDLNQDGYDDVIVGAPFYPSFKGDGRVYVFHGGPDMDNVADIILEGPTDERSFFGLMIAASDINQDGMVDILVGAQNYDHGGQYHPRQSTSEYGPTNGRGRVYLYWGGNPMDTIPDMVFEGENRGDWFGRRISANGDVNGDGYNDILVGARFAGTEDRGSAYLFLGNRKEEMDPLPDWTFRGEGKSHQMGSSVAIFDIDADGFADVLVGARGARSIYLYWGAKDFNGDHPGMILKAPTAAALGGDSIECGYFNEDRYGDILAGAFGYPGTGYMYGRAYLFFGNTKNSMDSDHDYVFGGSCGTNSSFGFQVSVGDVNGDGFTDALIGEPGYLDHQGRAYLHYGPFHDKSDITFNWDTTNASIGKHALKVEIPPVPGEQNTEDNVKTVTIEVKEPPK